MPFNLLYDYYSRTRHASGYHAQPGGTFYIKCVILSLVAKPSLGFIRAVSKDMALIFYLVLTLPCGNILTELKTRVGFCKNGVATAFYFFA